MLKSMRSSKNGRMWEAVERKLGHVTSAKLLQIEQRHFIIVWLLNGYKLKCSARFLRLLLRH